MRSKIAGLIYLICIVLIIIPLILGMADAIAAATLSPYIQFPPHEAWIIPLLGGLFLTLGTISAFKEKRFTVYTTPCSQTPFAQVSARAFGIITCATILIITMLFQFLHAWEVLFTFTALLGIFRFGRPPSIISVGLWIISAFLAFTSGFIYKSSESEKI